MSKQNALIVGGTGFAGSHMQQLLDSSYQVVVSGRRSDITDSHVMSKLVEEVEPDIVINFAAITTVRESFADPRHTYDVGFNGTLNLLTALKEYNFSGRYLNISSSEVYGFPKSEQLPLTEITPARPMSPYSVNKLATEALCYQWNQIEDFDIVTARPFTHIGPGQSDRFAISNFSKQIAEIILGRRDPVIRVGNLDATRDFTDVRDVVSAYKGLLETGKGGEVYNVCSDTEVNLSMLLGQLIETANVSIEVEQDLNLVRNVEQTRTRGCYKKIHQDIGWFPKIELSKTLSDTLSFWIDELK